MTYNSIAKLEVSLRAESIVALAEHVESIQDNEHRKNAQHIEGPMSDSVEKQAKTQDNEQQMKT